MQQTVKRRELELQENAEHLRVVAEFAADWELWIDEHGHCRHCSPSAEQITGCSAARFVEDPNLFWTLIDPRDIERVKVSLADLRDERATIPNGD